MKAVSMRFVAVPSILKACVVIVVALYMAGCASVSSSNASADLQQLDLKFSSKLADPKPHSDQYVSALTRFGALLETYRGSKSRPIYIQTRAIGDSTGLSMPLVGAELPNDITDIIRSAINSIGPLVVYTPFHPDYVVAHAQQGVNMTVTVPDVLMTGAITQFDRGVVSSGKSRDIGFMFGKGRGETSGSASNRTVSSFSKLGLDFNMIDFKTQTMIPRVQAVNTLNVLNESSEGALDFAILGNGIGYSSSTRYLQGRHQAVRALVEISMVQIIGRYANVPYWRILPNAEVDEVVLDRLRRSFDAQAEKTKVSWIQNTLRDYGESVVESGYVDLETVNATQRVMQKLGYKVPDHIMDREVFVTLFINVPINAI